MGVLEIYHFAKKIRKKGVTYFEIVNVSNGRDVFYEGDDVEFYIGDGDLIQGRIERMEGPNFEDVNIFVIDKDDMIWVTEPLALELIKSNHRNR